MPTKSRPTALLAWLLAGVVFMGHASAQTFEHDPVWAQSQVDYISTLGVTRVPTSPELTATTVAFRVQAAKPVFSGQCLSPASLAYSEIDNGIPTVVVCANNIQYYYRSLMPYFYGQFYDHDTMMNYGDDYRALIYDVSTKNRRYFRGNASTLLRVCDYGLFIYLKEKGIAESLCYFVDRSTEADTLLSGLIDHAKLAAFRRQDTQALPDDPAEATRLYRALATVTMTIILRYAILHEIGHLQHGDLYAPPGDLCRQLTMEERADDFAAQAMLQHRLINSADDLIVARLTWALTSARLSAGTLGEDLGNEAASERLLAAIAQTPRILEQLRRGSPVLADGIERGLGSVASLAPILDRVRRERHCK